MKNNIDSSRFAKLVEFLAGSILGSVLGIYFSHLSVVQLSVLGIGALILFLIAIFFPQSRSILILSLFGLFVGIVAAFIFTGSIWRGSTPRSLAPVVVNITSTKGWQLTGIQIEAGDDFEIRWKEGLWKGTLDGNFYGPDPGFSNKPLSCLPFPTDPGALIGMIGNHQPFKVGNSFRTVSTQAGELQLRMNDCDQLLGDNSDQPEGSMKIVIEIFD